ncbi:MAG: TolB family protein [Bacillota bacterium]
MTAPCSRWSEHRRVISTSWPDRTGAEKHQVYRVPVKGGVPEQLTDDPDVTYGGLLLSRDGRSLFYSGNAIDPAKYHIFGRDLATGETQPLCGGPGYLWVPGWESPDGRCLLVSAFVLPA